MSQQSQAAANALSGEKSFATINYPLTGDPELDLISAITACCNAHIQRHYPRDVSEDYSAIVRCLKFSEARFADYIEKARKQQEYQAEVTRMIQSQTASATPLYQQHISNPVITSAGALQATPVPNDAWIRMIQHGGMNP